MAEEFPEIRQLKELVDQLEGQVTTQRISLTGIEELKMAVDHVRMSLWAILSAEAAEEDMRPLISRFRAWRTAEMCHQIVRDIRQGEIPREVPELLLLHSALRDALSQVNRVFLSTS